MILFNNCPNHVLTYTESTLTQKVIATPTMASIIINHSLKPSLINQKDPPIKCSTRVKKIPSEDKTNNQPKALS